MNNDEDGALPFAFEKLSIDEHKPTRNPGGRLTDVKLEKITKYFQKQAVAFLQTDYFKNFSILFNDVMMREPSNKIRFDQVICYGLGRFRLEKEIRRNWYLNYPETSKNQIHFLMCLKELIKCPVWEVYDPEFSLDEQVILSELGFTVIKRNEYCRRSICENKVIKKTLFYMPHCPTTLYDNLFRSNWNIQLLNNLCLIGNSLSMLFQYSCEENHYLDKLKKMNIVDEHEIKDLFNGMDFRNLNLHTFTNTSHLKPYDLLF